jgi:hypothetical protein
LHQITKAHIRVYELGHHGADHGKGDRGLQAAVNAAKTFILDTLGVGLAGSSGPKARELVRAQSLWGSGDDGRARALAASACHQVGIVKLLELT